MNEKNHQIWDLWFPQAAATGLSFARCRIDPAEILLVHAAPPMLAVSVRDDGGKQSASGENLKATADTPITKLTLKDGKVEREDIWPDDHDIGLLVVLPGGEAGKLKSWWNAPDHSEWRWEVELYNKKGG